MASSSAVGKCPKTYKGKTPLLSYLATRTWEPYKSSSVYGIAKNHPPFMHQMNLMKQLPVHDGCVNTICWNKTGEYILSGSDDRNLCITKPMYLFDNTKDYTVLHKFPTRHLGNIFSAKFIPNSGDLLTASCSTEGPVIVSDLNSSNPTESILNYNCNSSIIYDIVTIADNDKTFLTCSEDKTIRLFDLRVHASCSRALTCPHPPLIRSSLAVTTLDLHPLNSNLLLAGRADGVGLVYDRRKLPDVTKFSRELAHQERQSTGENNLSATFRYVHPMEGVVSQFCVPDIEDKTRLTSLSYNNNGSEVLASYLGDYIYLFKHDRSSNVELIQTLPKKPVATDNEACHTGTTGDSPNNASEGHDRPRGPRIAGLRVRGDWSDTGINSMPSSRSQERNSDVTAPHRTATFLQHMAEIANSLGTRRGTRERSRFIPVTGIIEPIHDESSNESNSSSRRAADASRESDREFNEMGEEEDDGVDDDEDGDEVDDSDANDEEFDDPSDAGEQISLETPPATSGRVRKRTVGNLDGSDAASNHDEADNTETFSDHDESKARDKKLSKVSPQTKKKFQETVDYIKNKYSSKNIPTSHPCIKYQGHRHSRTSIKEAIFWGDNYIMSGSDCGRIWVWEKETARIVMGFPADDRVVNCLAPNPHHYVLASSGIDYDIKLWSTQSLQERPLHMSEEEMKRVVENNELMLEESKQIITVPPQLFIRVLASLAHRYPGVRNYPS